MLKKPKSLNWLPEITKKNKQTDFALAENNKYFMISHLINWNNYSIIKIIE